MNELAVYTTQDVVQEKSPILSVFHDLDGDWQFLGNELVTTENAMIVSLSQIIDIDASVNDILNMPSGYEAHRKSKKKSWKINKSQ